MTQPSERARATARDVCGCYHCFSDECDVADRIADAIDAETERCARIAEEIGGTYDCGCKPCYCEPQRVAHESACEAVAAEIRDETTDTTKAEGGPS